VPLLLVLLFRGQPVFVFHPLEGSEEAAVPGEGPPPRRVASSPGSGAGRRAVGFPAASGLVEVRHGDEKLDWKESFVSSFVRTAAGANKSRANEFKKKKSRANGKSTDSFLRRQPRVKISMS
jgi:hypothetical protein